MMKKTAAIVLALSLVVFGFAVGASGEEYTPFAADVLISDNYSGQLYYGDELTLYANVPYANMGYYAVWEVETGNGEWREFGYDDSLTLGIDGTTADWKVRLTLVGDNGETVSSDAYLIPSAYEFTREEEAAQIAQAEAAAAAEKAAAEEAERIAKEEAERAAAAAEAERIAKAEAQKAAAAEEAERIAREAAEKAAAAQNENAADEVPAFDDEQTEVEIKEAVETVETENEDAPDADPEEDEGAEEVEVIGEIPEDVYTDDGEETAKTVKTAPKKDYKTELDEDELAERKADAEEKAQKAAQDAEAIIALAAEIEEARQAENTADEDVPEIEENTADDETAETEENVEETAEIEATEEETEEEAAAEEEISETEAEGVQISLSSNVEDGAEFVVLGDEIVLTADVEGIDEYTVQWAYSEDGETFIPIEDANELTYAYNVDYDNIQYVWKVIVTPVPAAEPEATPAPIPEIDA